MRRYLRKPKHLVLLLLLIGAAAAGAWFLQPLHLPALPDGTVQIDVSSSRLQPYEIQQEEYQLTPDSPQWARLEELLSGVTCHRCFKTLSGSTSTGDTGGRVLSFYGRDGEQEIVWDVTITAGCHIRIGERIYHLGWWDEQSGQQLAEELARILKEG